MKKTMGIIVAIIAVVAIISIVYFVQKDENPLDFVFEYFDKEGNPTGSRVGGIEGIYSMQTQVCANNNKAGRPITFQINAEQSLPKTWADGFTGSCDTSILKNGASQTCRPATPQTANVGEKVCWTSALVKTQQFEGDVKTLFRVAIDGTYDYGGEQKLQRKYAEKEELILPDPNIDFDIEIVIG